MKKHIESLIGSAVIVIFGLSAISASAQSFNAPQNSNSQHSQTQQVVKFTKLSDFPIADSGGWSALYQNYIILKETTGPAGVFSKINVGFPSNPQRGTIDSLTARTLPPQSMIPVFIDSGVSNSYTNTHVVNLKDSRMLIAKDSTVEMVRISGNILTHHASLTMHDSVHEGGNKNLNLMLFNDALLGIQSTSCNSGSDFYLHFSCVSLLSGTPWFTLTPVNIWQTIDQSDWIYIHNYWTNSYFRPYFHGAVGQNMFISCDHLGYTYNESANPHDSYDNSYSCIAYNVSTGTNSPKTYSLPFANAYNTGNYLSSGEIVCTSGFAFDPFHAGSRFSFLPAAVPTELFAATVDDPWPYTTASACGAIYRDTVHKQNQIQNIILDTLTKRVYLLFNNNMSILSYEHVTVGAIAHADKTPSSQALTILPNSFSFGVTIVLPDRVASTGVDLSFYELTGRCIDMMRAITSHAVLWKPKTRSVNCYIVTAKIDGKTPAQKFIVR